MSNFTFGGRAVPGSGVVMPALDLNDKTTWTTLEFITKPNITIDTVRQNWRGQSSRLGGDRSPLKLDAKFVFDESAAGRLFALDQAKISQAAEQWLTINPTQQVLAEYLDLQATLLRPGNGTKVYGGTLSFLARKGYAEDIQPSGSLANLLKPYGGFEGAPVAPVLYSSTNIIQSNDFETASGTVDYGHSIGTEALGTLAAWTLDGSPTISNNVVTMPANGRAHTGHPDIGDSTTYALFQFATNSGPSVFIHETVATPSMIFGKVDGTNVYLYKYIGGTSTQIASAAAALTNGTSYWMVITASGTTYSAKVLADSSGVQGAQVGSTASGTISDAALQYGGVALAEMNGTAGCTFGGAFANVFYVTGPAPTGWTTNGNWSTDLEPWYCWSNKQAVYGAKSLSIYHPIANNPGSAWNGPSSNLGAGQTYSDSAWLKNTGSATGRVNLTGTVGVGPTLSGTAWVNSLGTYTPGAPEAHGLQLVSFCVGTPGSITYFDYAAIFQPAFPTNPLSRSLGTDSSGNLSWWNNQVGTAATIANNLMSVPSGSYINKGHPDLTDCVVIARAQYVSGGNNYPAVHARASANASQNRYRAQLGNANALTLDKTVGFTYTGLSSVSSPVVAGSFYWIQLQCLGTTISATTFKDLGGYPGDQIATTSVTDSSLTIGQCGVDNDAAAAVTTVFGGAFPNVFLIQSPLPTGWEGNTYYADSGEPDYCWSKASPLAGTYAASIFAVAGNAGASWNPGQHPVAVSGSTQYTITMQVKGVSLAGGNGPGIRVIEIGGAGLDHTVSTVPGPLGTFGYQAVTGTFTTQAATTSIQIRPQLYQSTGTVYFDNVVLQKGAYATAFVDQIPLAGSSGAGSATNFNLTYAGSVLTRPKFQINVPASNGAAISSIKIQNTLSSESLTVNFSTPLAAGQAWTITIDTDAYTITDQNGTVYDPVGSFPKLYPPVGTVNTFTATVVTSSGTTMGVTLDTSFTNHWEVQA